MSGLSKSEVGLAPAMPVCLCSILPRLATIERRLTVLRVSLHHPTQGPTVFATVPLRLQQDTNPLLLGWGLDTHLRLHLPCLSRQHLSLEPYREKGGAVQHWPPTSRP